MYFSIKYNGVLQNIQLIEEELYTLKKIKMSMEDSYENAKNDNVVLAHELYEIIQKIIRLEKHIKRRKEFLESLLTGIKDIQDGHKLDLELE